MAGAIQGEMRHSSDWIVDFWVSWCRLDVKQRGEVGRWNVFSRGSQISDKRQRVSLTFSLAAECEGVKGARDLADAILN